MRTDSAGLGDGADLAPPGAPVTLARPEDALVLASGTVDTRTGNISVAAR
jgi:hypothetical protein